MARINPFLMHGRDGGTDIFVWIFDIFLLGWLWFSVFLWRLAGDDNESREDQIKHSDPGQLPLPIRIIYVALSFLLLYCGLHILYAGSIYISSSRGKGLSFSGYEVWLLFAALLCAAVGMLSAVIGHYDKKTKRVVYANIAAVTKWLAWILFALLFALHILFI
ncbi:MAG: hypothetical protein ACXWJK_11470 [Burkholderiaceae bacterium]